MGYENPDVGIDDLGLKQHQEKEKVNDDFQYEEMDTVYFAFLDVLGFKQAFEDYKLSENPDIVNRYREIFAYYFLLIERSRIVESELGYAGQTSDSLYFYTDRIDILVKFMKLYLNFSLYAMSKGVFFRGGISKGNLFRKQEYQFYGDSIIRAYQLESTISKNPIVTIDEATNQDLLRTDDYEKLIDYDGRKNRHFLKPFALLESAIQLPINGDDGTIIKNIDKEKIKEVLNQNCKRYEFVDELHSKYQYLKGSLNHN